MTTATQARPVSRTINGLRLQLFITLILLAVELVLGITVNLFVKVPAADKGSYLFSAFVDALTRGPASLATHAIVGSLLVLASISVLIRAITTKRALQIVLSIVGLIGVFSGWSAGTGFVGNGENSASFGMAAGTALAILAYATALFAAPAVPVDKS